MRNVAQLLSRAGVVVIGSALLAQQTYAAGLADLAGGLDDADVKAGLTAVALILAGILALRMGIRKVLGMIR